MTESVQTSSAASAGAIFSAGLVLAAFSKKIKA